MFFSLNRSRFVMLAVGSVAVLLLAIVFNFVYHSSPATLAAPEEEEVQTHVPEQDWWRGRDNGIDQEEEEELQMQAPVDGGNLHTMRDGGNSLDQEEEEELQMQAPVDDGNLYTMRDGGNSLDQEEEEELQM